MTRRLFPLLLLSLFACAPATTTTSARMAPVAPQQLAATGRPHRVVLMSFDGLGADALAARTGLPSFDHLARTATTARVIPVNPTLTSSTHVSILTGADPQQHGIVSNWFHLPGTPADRVARGLDADIDAETLVEVARRQGKRVGAVPFPTVDARDARRTADFGLVWTSSVTEGRIVKLTKADFRREWVPPTWTQRPQRRTSYSPAMRARVEWRVSRELRTDVDVVALDTTDDRVENYDAYVIESEERELQLDRGWFAVTRQSHGSWSKILDAEELDVTLYWGPISRTNAYPEKFRTMLDEEIGFWPGAPDERAEIDAATFAEQVERLADFLTRAQALTVQRMEFDLLLAYQPVVDQALHNFPGQDAMVHRAYVAADRAVAAVGSQLDGNRDAFLVTGDHGLVPLAREVHLGVLLSQHGFAPRWRVFTSNHVAHFYRTGGQDDSDALVAMLRSSGIFESIEKKSAASHRNSGDVVAVSFPPIGLSASATPPLESRPDAYGHHGALNSHRELHTVLFASGFGVPPGTLGEIPQTRIAPFIAKLLGL